MKGRQLINRRGMLGAAIAEYLPLLSLVLLIVVGGAVQYAEELRRHAANVSEELAGEGGIGDIGIGGPRGAGGGGGGASTPGGTSGGGTGGSSGGTTTPTDPGGGTTTGPGDSGGTTPGDSLVDVDTPPTTPGDTPSDGGATGEKSVLASIGKFLEGLWDGVKTQFWGLVDMLLSPIKTANDLKELAISFVTDPKGTTEAIVAEFGEDVRAALSGDPYKVGKVIGENVSPAALARIVGKLATISKTPDVIAKRESAAKELDKECSSFLAGTLVWTDKGLLPIERLVVGDIVIGRDDRTFEDAPQRISKLHGREVSRYYELDTGYEKILVTEEHPYWLQGQGWTPVAELKAGDVLVRAEGDIQVHKIKFIQGPASVYNFTVEKTHSYFVGPNKLWVHNIDCPLDAPTTSFDAIKAKIPEELRDRFEADVKGTDLEKAFERNPDLADAWLLVKNGDATKHPEISTNLDALVSLNVLMKDAKTMSVLGEKGIQDILTAHKNSKIPLDYHLLNIRTVINNHSGVPGFDKLLKELKNPGLYTQKGIAHTLNAIKDYKPGDIKSFDLTFEGDGLPCAGCRYDVELEVAKAGDLRFVEFKSYALDSIPKIPLPQFKNYLSSAKSISEFKYVFNKLDTPNVADVKSKFQQVFNKDPEGIFDAMSDELKDSLKIRNVAQLQVLIDNPASSLYTFIEVK